MRRFLIGSATLHIVLALSLLRWAMPPGPPSGEVPATIQVLFGDNADQNGAPRASTSASAASAPGPAAPEADPDGVPAPTGGEAAAPAPTPPVRLGDGDVGLRLDAPPDPQMIEAQADPGNRAPKYPQAAAILRQQGRVVIRMHIDPRGRVIATDILESSGYPTLDRAAREALEKWRFIPALRDGAAAPSYRDQATNFVLD